MKNALRALPLLLLPFVFAPLLMAALCGGNAPPPQPQYPEVAMALAGELDRQLVPRLGMYTRDNSRGLYWVVVATPADLSDLSRASPLARLFGQELSTALVALGYNVQEIRKAGDIMVSKGQGEFALTRDAQALAVGRATATLVVAGTYVVTPGGVRFAVEVIDARNNNIVAAANRTLPMDATVGALAGTGASFSAPTVSTVDAETFRREMTPYAMARHW
ncbi:FlgO family outer membrane protein [Solidesulfovibrio sp.]|uniref:FlgO family outer membrane protein n=1 Tax=Solidesulfovibrio sp. TaxID=2910990 RepID=UPI002B1F1F8D|nr:FlgO family outer membrane protein [Solidesulfovibrio sp.]MEA5089427.1 FlgO family outer membrane protein [Solidesulfovibrio sp.]